MKIEIAEGQNFVTWFYQTCSSCPLQRLEKMPLKIPKPVNILYGFKLNIPYSLSLSSLFRFVVDTYA